MSSGTDVIMKNLWKRLSEDAIAVTNGDVGVAPVRSLLLQAGDLKEFRSWRFCPDLSSVDPYLLKWRLQLDSLFKRYSFANDAFEDQELSDTASAKFAADQRRISQGLNPSVRALMVLREARKIVKSILRSYDSEEHATLSKFSSHANWGIPYSQSYYDCKARTLTGSVEHISWFQGQLKSDPGLKHAVYEQGRPKLKKCASLRLAKVPKSWKAFRTMMPHTVCGSFYTYGLGNVIRERLLDVGLDISRLQDRHKMLAKVYSVTRTHVTADLSAASDSFNRELLCRLLPRDWFRAVTFGSPRYYEDDGVTYSLQSVMTMGMGHTFPLQTLLFYALLRAVQSLLGVRGRVSVYGDDLIYPRKMHCEVTAIFAELNFRLNAEKTFVTSHFRESCGGDYYRGFDMRPFCPEGRAQTLSRKQLLEFLYKLYNGLRLRWSEWEVSRSLHYLLVEIVNVEGVVHQVPPTYPATAGIQVSVPNKPGLVPWSPVKRGRAWSECYTFRYLRRVAANREVAAEGLHLWHAMRDAELGDQPLCMYTKGRPRLRLVMKTVHVKGPKHQRKKISVAVEDDRRDFLTLSQTGHDSWSKGR